LPDSRQESAASARSYFLSRRRELTERPSAEKLRRVPTQVTESWLISAELTENEHKLKTQHRKHAFFNKALPIEAGFGKNTANFARI
jgi:hypothetical protein